MIHITFKSFRNDFQISVMRHPKVKFWVKKHLRGRTELLWKESKIVAQNHIHKSYFSQSFKISRRSIDFDPPKMKNPEIFWKNEILPKLKIYLKVPQKSRFQDSGRVLRTMVRIIILTLLTIFMIFQKHPINNPRSALFKSKPHTSPPQ